MSLKNKKIYEITLILLAAVIVIFSVSNIIKRFPQINDNNIKIIAANLTLPGGSRFLENDTDTYSTNLDDTNSNYNDTSSDNNSYTSSTLSGIDNNSTGSTASLSENMHPVTEVRYSAGGIEYDNFYVKNSTNTNISISQEIKAKLGFKMEDTTEPQVLIVHTHTSESYMEEDLGYYYDSFYPRSDDQSKNVCAVGDAVTNSLKNAGINTIHITTVHDTTYTGSYKRSAESIKKCLEEYPSIKVILDIHRDSIEADDGEKIKPTFIYNGRKAAQIMIMAGYDGDGSLNFPNWRYNLRFALRLQQCAEDMYPGMTRPLYFGNFAYNMYINTGSLLIEVGTDANTVEEAVYTGELLGNVIAKTLANA